MTAPRPKLVRAGVLGYVRVSTEEQAASGLGLASQREVIEAECLRRGVELLDVVVDAGVSGRSLKRAGMTLALARLAELDGPALLMAAKLDRLSRSMLDFVGLVERSQREGWALVVLDLGLDLASPQGRFTAHILSAVAELERGLISERTKAALAVKLARGERLGRPLSIPPEVRWRIAQLRAEGLTLRGICAELTAAGVPTSRGGLVWHAETVANVLRHPD